jgi:hypothetical protein
MLQEDLQEEDFAKETAQNEVKEPIAINSMESPKQLLLYYLFSVI